MGLTKTEIFTEEQNKIALFAKVFGHPARVAILQHLFKINACVCGDLVNEIGLAQPTICVGPRAKPWARITRAAVEPASGS